MRGKFPTCQTASRRKAGNFSRRGTQRRGNDDVTPPWSAATRRRFVLWERYSQLSKLRVTDKVSIYATRGTKRRALAQIAPPWSAATRRRFVLWERYSQLSKLRVTDKVSIYATAEQSGDKSPHSKEA